MKRKNSYLSLVIIVILIPLLAPWVGKVIRKFQDVPPSITHLGITRLPAPIDSVYLVFWWEPPIDSIEFYQVQYHILNGKSHQKIYRNVQETSDTLRFPRSLFGRQDSVWLNEKYIDHRGISSEWIQIGPVVVPL